MTRFRTCTWLLLALIVAAQPQDASGLSPRRATWDGRGIAEAPEPGRTSAEAEALMSAGKAHQERQAFETAIEAYGRAAEIFRRERAGSALAACLQELALAYKNAERYDDAIAAHLEAAGLFTAADDRRGAALSWYELGRLYWHLGRLEEALAQYRAALPVWEAVDDTLYQARTLNNIGVIFFRWAGYREALSYYNRSLALRREIDDARGVALVLNNIGQTYQRWGQLDRAQAVYEEAYVYARPLREDNALGYTLYNLASVHEERKEFGRALKLYEQSESEYRAASYPGGVVETLIGKGMIYAQSGRTAEALRLLTRALEQARSGRLAVLEAKALQRLGQFHARNGQHEEALARYEESLAASLRMNERELVKETYLLASDSYEALGRHAESLRHYKLHAAAEDSIYGARSEQLMRELELKREAVRKAEELTLLRHVSRHRQIAVVIVSSFLALVALLALWLYRANRQKMAANLLLGESNAQILRERDEQRTLLQILCHDLANPLTSVHGLLEVMLEEEGAVAELGPTALQGARNGLDMINLVREMQMLERGDLVLGPVDLLEAVENAALVLQGRLQEKSISLSVDVHPEIQVWAERRSLSNSVVANLLTNAIKFSPDGSAIEIRAALADERVCLSIRDHGIGMPAAVREHLFGSQPLSSRPGTRGERGSGFGLPLVSRFLERYGAHAEVTSAEAHEDPIRHGTEVRITFRAAGTRTREAEGNDRSGRLRNAGQVAVAG